MTETEIKEGKTVIKFGGGKKKLKGRGAHEGGKRKCPIHCRRHTRRTRRALRKSLKHHKKSMKHHKKLMKHHKKSKKHQKKSMKHHKKSLKRKSRKGGASLVDSLGEGMLSDVEVTGAVKGVALSYLPIK